MRGGAVLENKNQLMLGSVETSRFGVLLRPNTQSFLLAVYGRGGLEHFAVVPPIIADVVD